MRLVGINVNTDREFGLALLRFLAEELRRRADAAKKHEVTKLAELRAGRPDRALAADRRGGRRVPGAAGRPGRGRPGGRRPAGGPGPPGPVAGHPPGARLPGRPRHRGAVGAARAGRPVHPADRAAQGAAHPGRTQRRRRSRCPGTTRWSTPSRVRRRRTRWPGSRRPATGSAGACCSTGCGGTPARTAPPGSSTGTRFRGCPRRRTSGRWPRPGTGRAAPVALLGEIIDVQARSAALRLPVLRAATWRCSAPGATRRARCWPPRPAPWPASTHRAPPGSAWSVWTTMRWRRRSRSSTGCAPAAMTSTGTTGPRYVTCWPMRPIGSAPNAPRTRRRTSSCCTRSTPRPRCWSGRIRPPAAAPATI